MLEMNTVYTELLRDLLVSFRKVVLLCVVISQLCDTPYEAFGTDVRPTVIRILFIHEIEIAAPSGTQRT
jgi:hypothetical protein